MKLSRDAWLGIGVLLALVLLTVAAGLQQSHEINLDYLSTSAGEKGTLALKLWLADLGYAPLEGNPSEFDPGPEIRTIFIIQPILTITESEWKLLDEWVEAGGVLVVAGDNFETFRAVSHYEFSLDFMDPQATELTAATPLLNSPALAAKIPLTLDLALGSARTDFVPLLAADGKPVVVAFEKGYGRVILSAAPHLFSNLALKDEAAAAAVLNIIALAGETGMVWFDEWHHGVQTVSVLGPEQWLRRTPGGHALLFVVGVLFLALLLQGRAFGRPVPLAHEIKRRGPMEHVTAIASLNRKAGHRAEVLRQYHQRLKRHLGYRYRLDPSLPDAEYVDELSKYNPTIDREKLLNLLRALSQDTVSEGELVKLASEAAQWIKD
ncbi:MAG: DUF4350 domain-containing protein [Chloroflexota bacterium]